MGNQRARRLTLFAEGLTLQTKERRALPMYVTYSDLIQIGIFIYPCRIVLHDFQGKTKIAAITCDNDG